MQLQHVLLPLKTCLLAKTIISTISPISGLVVSISVSYTPPLGAELGPNQYRAASGPVNVTCTAVGGTGPVIYQWSSTCRDCPFQTATSSYVTRAAVHSGDTGTHTCRVTRGSITGSANINFNVVGKCSCMYNFNFCMPLVRKKSVLENIIGEQLIIHWLSVKQVLVYIFSGVRQLLTFKSQDYYKTMKLLFPLTLRVIFVSALSVALTQWRRILGHWLDQVELLSLLVVSLQLPTHNLGNSE